jgi:ADP-dependent NAD(P)H-hydrate dehydratase / NAD(P)H-hydrate epimerase
MKIAWVEEIQNMDRDAIQKYGISDELLMENAGMAVCQTIAKKLGIRNRHFLIFCGTGNNGGDGLVVARKLYSNGAHIKLCILSNPEKYKGAALKNWQIIQKIDLPILIMPSIEKVKSLIKSDNIIVDAIFGTGLTRDITGTYFQVIQLINQMSNPVISIDIPSGINGNNGTISGIAIKADYTITFGLPKMGNILYPGYEYGGNLSISHISFPPALYESEDLKTQINIPLAIPDRQKDGHKGTFGDALFIAGAHNYYGAPYFSSLSFLKAGGGYSRLAAPASVVPYISTKASEIVFLPQKETDSGSISLNNFDELLACSEKMDVVILGPGLSLQEETQVLVRKLIVEIKKPLLIDGDGLTALSHDISILNKRQQPTILTPHSGEMARLIKQTTQKIKEDPIHIIQEFTHNYNTICMLKGAHSIIGLPNGEIYINMTGNSGMASAGSGDVLTGTIAAMFTLGLPIVSAVRQGTLVHGFAGDLAAQEKGEDGITAQDILESLPQAVKTIRENQKKEKQVNFSGLTII